MTASNEKSSPPILVKEHAMKSQRHFALLISSPALALLVALTSLVTMLSGPVALAQQQAVSASWTVTGKLKHRRSDHTATLLPSGKVLVVGGLHDGVLNTAELYDPVTETWSATGNRSEERRVGQVE